MLIRTEPQALAAANVSLQNSNDITNRLLDQLATGQRNRLAADDVLAVSQTSQFTGEIKALNAARSNVGQAQSLLVTAATGLEEIGGILSRMQQIASIASTNTIGTQERAFFEVEFNDLKDQISQTVDTTRFSDIQVLSGAVAPPAGQIIVGTAGADNLTGGDGNDAIEGLAGNDVISAGIGNDQVTSTLLSTPGLQGRVFRSGAFGNIANIAEAEQIIANEPVFASFRATSLDYPNGAQNNQNGLIGTFLGADAASLDNGAAAGTNADRSVYEFTGTINAPAAGNYNFSIGSDDGFDLQIDGASVLTFPNPRGFAFTNGVVALDAGANNFRLVFFENTGSEGLEVFSDVGGANAIVTSAITSTFESDGNDTIDGGTGDDTVVYDGNQADYTVNVTGAGQAQVIDNRPGNPNGTDTLVNIETIQFADASQTIGAPTADPDPNTVNYQVSEEADNIFSYAIVDAQLDALFDTPLAVNVGTQANATTALADVEEAQNRLGELSGYVQGLRSGSEFIDSGLLSRIGGDRSARSFFSDTDIPSAGTEYIQRVVRQNAAASQIAQTSLFNRQNLDLLLNVGIRTIRFE